jgi:hypothetical protein
VRLNLAMQLRELRRASESLLDCRCSQQHHDPRRDEIDLAFEPVFATSRQFIAPGGTISRRPTFHAVRDEDLSTRHPYPAQHVIEEPASAANEWTTFSVFCTSRRFAHEHDASGYLTFAWHSMRAAFTEPAFRAPPDAFMKGLEHCLTGWARSHQVSDLQFPSHRHVPNRSAGHVSCKAQLLAYT